MLRTYSWICTQITPGETPGTLRSAKDQTQVDVVQGKCPMCYTADSKYITLLWSLALTVCLQNLFLVLHRTSFEFRLFLFLFLDNT